jgi:hypothetical protein
MLCALVGVQPKSELFDSSKSLELRRVDQLSHQLAFGRVGANPDDVVDGVTIDTFSHFSTIVSPMKVAQKWRQACEAELTPKALGIAAFV